MKVLAAALALTVTWVAPLTGWAATETAVFAGGCFWCMEPPFDQTVGVISTVSGYTGGKKEKPTYEEVSSGDTGHREAIEITYDSAKVSYEKLLEVFWRNVDPYDGAGQFCDKGYQYTSAIYYSGDTQKKLAEESRRKLIQSGALKGEIATKIEPAAKFYAAEDYHQDYYTKNPIRYKYYRLSCGRDARLKKVWGGS